MLFGFTFSAIQAQNVKPLNDQETTKQIQGKETNIISSLYNEVKFFFSKAL